MSPPRTTVLAAVTLGLIAFLVETDAQARPRGAPSGGTSNFGAAAISPGVGRRSGFGYSNHFTAIPAAMPYARPFRGPAWKMK